MPNISITRRCRRDCAFCFAQYERAHGGMLDMPRDVYDKTLAFLRRSKVPDARILGGEPTEHPAFCEYVAVAIAQGFAVTVFTGGLVPDGALEYLAGIPPRDIAVVLNVAIPGTAPAELVRSQERLCEALRAKVRLGVTLTTPVPDLAFLLDLIDRHRLHRGVRMGVAHPILGGGNACMRPQSVRILGNSLEMFVGMAEKNGVGVDFDCGFTPCMFSPGFLSEHAGLSKSIGTRCDSIIDILPEGKAIACYALSRARRLPLTDTTTRDELIAAIDRELLCLFPSGTYRDCAFCLDRAEGRCGGGCRARRAMRWRPDPERLLPVADPE